MSDQREKILSCACDLYLQDGLDGFSMRKLARAVGVTAPALYRHYDSRDMVLLDVVGEAYERLAQYLYRALEGTTPAERFRMAGQGYLSFALEHRRLYEMLFANPDITGMGERSEELEARACAIGQFWNDRVRECMDAGILRQTEPEAVGVTLWAHSHGLISLYLMGALRVDEATFRELYSVSTHRVLRGLASHAFGEELQTEMDGAGEALSL